MLAIIVQRGLTMDYQWPCVWHKENKPSQYCLTFNTITISGAVIAMLRMNTEQFGCHNDVLYMLVQELHGLIWELHAWRPSTYTP